MKHKGFILALLLHCSILLGQDGKYKANLIICDAQNAAIPAAAIVDTVSGKGVISDAKGAVTWWFNDFPLILKVSHVSYKTDYIIIRDYKEFTEAYLNKTVRKVIAPKEVLIDEVLVHGDTYQIMTEYPYAVLDFVALGDRIVAIGCENGHLLKKDLIYGDIQRLRFLTTFNNARGFLRDCLGDVYITTRDSVFPLLFAKDTVMIGSPVSAGYFKNVIDPIKAVFSDGFIHFHPSPNNQHHEYYYINESDSITHAFYQLGNRNKEGQLYGAHQVLKNHWILKNSRSYWENLEMRWLNDINAFMFGRINTDFKPVHSSLVPFRDTFLLFDFSKGTINCFDKYINPRWQADIKSHLDPRCTGTVHYDKLSGRCFLEYHDIQKTDLYEINPRSGELVKRFSITNHRHIEKLQIANGRAYYLYQSDLGNELKQLFSLKL